MIKYLHNGKEYVESEETIEAMTLAAMRREVDERLAPFMDRIEASGGSVTVNLSIEQARATVDPQSLPPELEAAIRKAFDTP